MKILLTNDDGIQARGLWHLYDAIKEKHDVTVVAPLHSQSGVGHAFTLSAPLRIGTAPDCKGGKGWTVNGTPSDCVKMGLTQILKAKPDVVLSGINEGDNTGVSQHYSGTVGAAREAALWGIHGIATSVSCFEEEHFQFAGGFIASHLEQLLTRKTDGPLFLNINLPNTEIEKIKGVKVTRQGCAMFDDNYQKRQDMHGKDYFWIYGNKPESQIEPDSDDRAFLDRYISVTPLSIDATDEHTKDVLSRDMNWQI